MPLNDECEQFITYRDYILSNKSYIRLHPKWHTSLFTFRTEITITLGLTDNYYFNHLTYALSFTDQGKWRDSSR